MKRNITILISLLAVMTSCNKFDPANELVIALDDKTLDVQVTKATAISAIPSTLYWAATTGTSGFSETRKYESTSGTVVEESSAKKIHTGKYQTPNPSTYNWYVANQAITTTTSAGVAVLNVANNSVDIIAGFHKATNTTTPTITLEHIFARTGTFTLNTQDYNPATHEFEDKKYLLSKVSWKIKSKAGSTGGTAGTYNLGEKAWSGLTALGEQGIGTLATGSTTDYKTVHTSDLYCTPGVYTLTVGYTLSKLNDTGTIDYVKDFVKTTDVTLKAGAINNITATAKSADAQEIIITVTLTPWGENNITATLPD